MSRDGGIWVMLADLERQVIQEGVPAAHHFLNLCVSAVRGGGGGGDTGLKQWDVTPSCGQRVSHGCHKNEEKNDLSDDDDDCDDINEQRLNRVGPHMRARPQNPAGFPRHD